MLCSPVALLYAKRHDAVDDVVVVLLESLDGFLPAHICLSHNELDILRLQTSVVYLLSVVFFFFGSLGSVTFDSLALVALSSVIVAGVLVGRLRGELLGGGSLGLRVEVLDLSLAEDAGVETVSIT